MSDPSQERSMKQNDPQYDRNVTSQTREMF